MSTLMNQIVGSDMRMAALMVAVILSLRICCHLFPSLKTETGIALVAPLRQSYSTQQDMAATGHP